MQVIPSKPTEIIMQSRSVQLRSKCLQIQNPQNFECRICLQNMESKDLLEVCKCRGTNANVHEKCLVEWIKRSKKYKFWMGEYYSICEICKSNIYLQTVTKYRWITSDQVSSELFNKHRCCTVMAFLSIFFNFLAIVIISFLGAISSTGITSSVFVVAYCIVVGIILLTFVIYVIKCMIKQDIAELVLVRKKTNKNKMPVKEQEFVFERSSTADTLYPQQTKSILIN